MVVNMNRTNEHCLEPEEIVNKYYQALYSGDLSKVKDLMTEESYLMTLEPFGLKLSFNDPLFKAQWDKIEQSKDALHEVEQKLSVELLSRNLSPQIETSKIVPNGLHRMTVYYEKDGKNKKLYFSKENGQWFIDYFAGRPVPPVPESYFSRIKKWLLSLLPSFK